MAEAVAHKCQDHGCPSAYGIQCAYVDQKGNHCQTSWCQDHVRMVEGTPYCRRHAPVVEALRDSHFAQHFPGINNRAPSLANWMGTALDPGVRRILETLREKAQGETLVSQELAYYFLLPKREHRWERAWKIISPSGVKIKVAVQVDETDDSLVNIEAAHQRVMQIVPPWVIRRKELVSVDAAADMREREGFYQDILEAIARVVGATNSLPASRS